MNFIITLFIFSFGILNISSEKNRNDLNEESINSTTIALMCQSENTESPNDGLLPNCNCASRLSKEGHLFLESDTGGNKKSNRPHINYKCIDENNEVVQITGTPYILNMKISHIIPFENSFVTAMIINNSLSLEYSEGMDINNALTITDLTIDVGKDRLFDFKRDDNNMGNVCDPHKMGSKDAKRTRIVHVALTNGQGCPIEQGTSFMVSKFLPPMNFVTEKPLKQGYYTYNVTVATPNNEPAFNLLIIWSIPDGYFIDVDDDIDPEIEEEALYF